MKLSHFSIDYIKTYNNDNIGMKQPIYTFNEFSLFFSVFINIHEYPNYANMITYIFDHQIKDLCLSFHLVQILVIYG